MHEYQVCHALMEARAFPQREQAGADPEGLVGKVVQEGLQQRAVPRGLQPRAQILAQLGVKLRHARRAQHLDAQQLPGGCTHSCMQLGSPLHASLSSSVLACMRAAAVVHGAGSQDGQ
jgi:hypothetical protein